MPNPIRTTFCIAVGLDAPLPRRGVGAPLEVAGPVGGPPTSVVLTFTLSRPAPDARTRRSSSESVESASAACETLTTRVQRTSDQSIRDAPPSLSRAMMAVGYSRRRARPLRKPRMGEPEHPAGFGVESRVSWMCSYGCVVALNSVLNQDEPRSTAPVWFRILVTKPISSRVPRQRSSNRRHHVR